jgi:hypothetical protein
MDTIFIFFIVEIPSIRVIFIQYTICIANLITQFNKS